MSAVYRIAAGERCDPLISPLELTAGANVIYTYCFPLVCFFPFLSFFFFFPRPNKPI